MKVLVTGATGFLGGHVAEALVAKGHNVVLMSRKPEGQSKPGVEWVSHDLGRSSPLPSMPAVDAVVHAAALVPPAGDADALHEEIYAVNAIGTLNLLKWAALRGVRHFVYCSSMSVYGPEVSMPVGEAAETYPIGRHAIYGASKLAGELFAESMRRERGVSVHSLRFSTLFGKGMKADQIPAIFVKRAKNGDSLMVHEDQRSGDFLYVKDAAVAILAALEHQGTGGVFNVGSGIETTILQVANVVNEVVKSSSKVVIDQLGRGRRFWMNVEKAKRELGFVPRFGLREALQDWITSDP